MSLTLEEVRRVRFRMARPRETGYAVADVDNFIDKVEESFASFENDRDLMRRELESANATSVDGDDQSGELQEARSALAAKEQELQSLRQQLERANEAPQGALAGDEAAQEVARLRAANQQLETTNEQLEAQNEQLRDQLENTRDELDRARSERIANVSGQPQQITVHAAEDAAPAVTRLLQMATDQAGTLVSEAEVEAARKLADAELRSTEIKTDARTRAERIESEARVNAEQMVTEAESRASRLNIDTENRRTELFADLEREQGELSGKVSALRDFESKYRTNLGQSLQSMLESLSQDHPEPEDVPELAQPQSETPRLDALAESGE